MKTNKIIVEFFPTKKYGKRFVNEMARLLNNYGKLFKIDTQKRLAMFIAHVKAEVDTRNGKAIMRENMNYSTRRLKQVFQTMRLHPHLAEQHGRNYKHKANQAAIANIVYANRLGNRGIGSHDGWRYRGAGVLQSTGRYNIRRDAQTVKSITSIELFDDDGEVIGMLLNTYTIGILLGMANWYRTELWKYNFERTIDIINYYTDSRAKRRKLYKKALKIVKENS